MPVQPQLVVRIVHLTFSGHFILGLVFSLDTIVIVFKKLL